MQIEIIATVAGQPSNVKFRCASIFKSEFEIVFILFSSFRYLCFLELLTHSFQEKVQYKVLLLEQHIY